MTLFHSSRTWCRSEWQIPQNRISICTSRSAGSRREMVVDVSADVALAAEYAFALYIELRSSILFVANLLAGWSPSGRVLAPRHLFEPFGIARSLDGDLRCRAVDV